MEELEQNEEQFREEAEGLNEQKQRWDEEESPSEEGLKEELPEVIEPPKPAENLKFWGEGTKYFGIAFVNFLLTVLTFGLYYPWAKARTRRYLWNETEAGDSRFVFHGTGKEMFKGFVIGYGIIVGLYLMLILTIDSAMGLLFVLLFYFALIALMPFAIFGGWKYRVTRTSWRGIYGRFDGELKPFLKMYAKGIFFTIITFGIYGSWFQVNIRKYLFEHTSLGNIRLGFKGDGGNLLGITYLGLFATYLSLGLFFPQFVKMLFNFNINNTTIEQEGNVRFLNSTMTSGQSYKVLMVNFLLLVVTLGLAFPWTFMRWMRLSMDNIQLPEGLDLDAVEQIEGGDASATGDELMDIFDMDFGI